MPAAGIRSALRNSVPDNEHIVRDAYDRAEARDIPGWVGGFTADGTFTDNSTGVIYRGETLGDFVEIYATAFSDMHRELHRLHVSNDIVVVQLTMRGTQDGPLVLPTGTIPATGKQIDAPCCDVWEVTDGKIKKFDCYLSVTVIMAQLGVLGGAFCGGG